MSKKSLDDLFRDAFDEPTDAPSNELWQRLEKRLDDRRVERRRKRRIRFLQPGIVILTVALLLLAALAGWYFVKNHKPKVAPKPLIFKELGWLEGEWEGEMNGKTGRTKWAWANDSTIIGAETNLNSLNMWAMLPNRIFQRGDSLFFKKFDQILAKKNIELLERLSISKFESTRDSTVSVRFVKFNENHFDIISGNGFESQDTRFTRVKPLE